MPDDTVQSTLKETKPLKTERRKDVFSKFPWHFSRWSCMEGLNSRCLLGGREHPPPQGCHLHWEGEAQVSGGHCAPLQQCSQINHLHYSSKRAPEQKISCETFFFFSSLKAFNYSHFLYVCLELPSRGGPWASLGAGTVVPAGRPVPATSEQLFSGQGPQGAPVPPRQGSVGHGREPIQPLLMPVLRSHRVPILPALPSPCPPSSFSSSELCYLYPYLFSES